jgi:hypothetical protein
MRRRLGTPASSRSMHSSLGGSPIYCVRIETSTNRARRLAAHIATRIAADPTIIDRAVEWLDPSKRALAEWRSVLTSLSSRQVEALLLEESERADRLRQSLPFVDVLTPEDRAAVFREVE